jgi:hypothetical protein
MRHELYRFLAAVVLTVQDMTTMPKLKEVSPDFRVVADAREKVKEEKHEKHEKHKKESSVEAYILSQVRN